MARKRMIAPELLTNPDLATMPVASRLGWVALVLYVDDYGRGRDVAALVRAHSWPLDTGYSAAKVERDLARYERAGMICRYDFDGERLFHMPGWLRWQRLDHPAKPHLSPCPRHEPQVYEIFARDSRERREGLASNVVQMKIEELNAPPVDNPACELHGRRVCLDCRRRGAA